jgi:hypothetical protein
VSEFNSLYTSFLGKNIVYITVRVNLIHSKLFFFIKKMLKKLIQKKKKNKKRVHVNSASELHCRLSEQCNSLVNSASELHCSLFFK